MFLIKLNHNLFKFVFFIYVIIIFSFFISPLFYKSNFEIEQNIKIQENALLLNQNGEYTKNTR